VVYSVGLCLCYPNKSLWDGEWKPDKNGAFRSMGYENGDACQPISEKLRSAQVEIACAKDRLELVRVHELSTCEYRLLMHTPFPCHPFKKAKAVEGEKISQTQDQLKELKSKWEQLRDEVAALGDLLGVARPSGYPCSRDDVQFFTQADQLEGGQRTCDVEAGADSGSSSRVGTSPAQEPTPKDDGEEVHSERDFTLTDLTLVEEGASCVEGSIVVITHDDREKDIVRRVADLVRDEEVYAETVLSVTQIDVEQLKAGQRICKIEAGADSGSSSPEGD